MAARVADNAIVEQIAPNVPTIKHWGRLLNCALLAASPRIDGATTRQTYGTNVLDCLPQSHGRLRIIAAITDRPLARKPRPHP